MHGERRLLGPLSSAEGERAWLAEAGPCKDWTAEAEVLRVLLSALCLPGVVLPGLSEPAPALQSLYV